MKRLFNQFSFRGHSSQLAPSLSYLLDSHVWQQDHNGFTHQDPGYLDHVINKKADVVRVYLPPAASCLQSVFDHCRRNRLTETSSWPGTRARSQWLSRDQALVHRTEGKPPLN